MRSPLYRFVEYSLRKPNLVLGFYVVLSAAAAPGLLLLKNDNSPDAFFLRASSSREVYDRFQHTFGRDSALRLAVAGPGLWTPQGLQWLADLERDASQVFGVVGVAGLYTHHAWRFPEWPPPTEEFRDLALTDPLDSEAGWVSADASTVTVLLALSDLRPVEVRELVESLRDLVGRPPPRTETWIAGLPAIQSKMDDLLFDFLKFYMPLLAFLVLGIMLTVFRSFAAILPPLFLVGVCETTVLGAMGYWGVSINMIVILLVPLLLVITLATAIHVLLRFRQFRQTGLKRDESVRAAYREKAWPVVWTGLTTAAAFGSLLTSPVGPVRDLGLWSALGIGLVTVAALTLFPALLSVGRPGRSLHRPVLFERRMRVFGRRCAGWSIRHRRMVFLLFAASALVWLAGAAKLDVQTSVLSYFRAEQRDQWRIERLESKGIGVVAAELILSSENSAPPFFVGSDSIGRLRELCKRLRTLPRVLGVVSPVQLLDSLESGPLGASGNRQAPSTILSRFLPFLLSTDGSRARISIQLPVASFEEWDPILESSRKLAKEHFPELKADLTGRFQLVLESQRETLRTMLSSMTIGLVLVSTIFGFFLGKAEVGFRALLPNFWPVLFVIGVMGWMQVPLDSTTVMIAAVALGLVVDDTLHALGLFRILDTSGNSSAASRATLERTAAAHCLSSLLLCAGFAVCSLSGFLPVARFGALAALAILAALAGDLILLPALLAGKKRVWKTLG